MIQEGNLVYKYLHNRLFVIHVMQFSLIHSPIEYLPSGPQVFNSETHGGVGVVKIDKHAQDLRFTAQAGQPKS